MRKAHGPSVLLPMGVTLPGRMNFVVSIAALCAGAIKPVTPGATLESEGVMTLNQAQSALDSEDADRVSPGDLLYPPQEVHP